MKNGNEEKLLAFEELRDFATKPGAPAWAGVVLDELHRLATAFYPQPCAAPDDVARLVDSAAKALRYIPKPTGSNVERDWKKMEARKALAGALAAFSISRQETAGG